VELDQGRDGLGSHPRQARGPEQDRIGLVDLRAATSAPRAIWAAGPRSAGPARERHGSAGEGGRDRALGVEGDDDDRGRPTGPRDVADPPNGGKPVGVGERGLGTRGEDHGGNRHERW
jgi:hypothetical protein